MAIVVSHQLPVAAQDIGVDDPAASLATETDSVEARLKRIDDSAELDKDLKPKLVDLYKGALEQLQAAADWKKTVKDWKGRRDEAPNELQKLKEDLQKPRVEPQTPENATLAQLDQRLADAETALKTAQQKVTDREAEPKRRRSELPGLVAQAQKRLKDVEQELSTISQPGDALDPSEARRVMLSAMKRAVQAELAAYDSERVWYETNTELLATRQDAAAHEAAQAEENAKFYRELVNNRRKEEAMKQAEEARRAAVAAMPELKTLADRNAELTQEQNGPDGFPAKIAVMSQDVDDLKQLLAALRMKFDRVRERIDAAGVTDAVGLLLQKQQADLPDLRAHRQRLWDCQSEASHVRAKLLELEDQRAELSDVEVQVRRVMGTIDPNLLPYRRDEIETALRELLKARQGYLQSQIDDGYRYLDGLGINLIITEKNLVEEIEKYKEFISERILWVRSTPALGEIDFRRGWDGLLKISDRGQFWTVLRDLAGDARQNPMVYTGALALLIPLVGAQRHLRRRIHVVDQQTTQSYAADIRPTLHVVALTLLIAALWPVLIAFVGWRMTAPAATSLHAQNIAYGLRVTAILFLSLEVLRQICRKKGLAEAHFGWPAVAVARVAHHLRWSMVLGLPLAFTVSVVESPEFDVHRSPLGRLAFILGSLVMAAFSHCVLHPKRGLLPTVAERPDVSWFWKKPLLWYSLAVTGPLALAVIAAVGYFYTALELAWRLHAMMWLLLGLLIVQAFAQRCLLVARRKLAIKQARDRRVAALAHAQSIAHPGTIEPANAAAEQPVDLMSIDLQTRRLLRSFVNIALFVGCWLIWIDVLPALGILDRFQLWPYTTTKHQEIGGGYRIETVGSWITLGDVLFSGVIVLLTIVASRNLPGLLQIAFLQRLPMDPGGRYAITTVSRYVITLVGLAVAFWMIGIGWSNIQWLVAAMTVGLGFGLQEIFANFVSGLIILFERPMRVGDVVTIGGISGSVARIRIRATTITDADRKELIVPNKEFITGQLINWTLSDTVLRMVIKVGIAYGSDIAVARQLLLKAAQEDHRVLRDPPVAAVLDQFGDSTLNFELRLFVGGLDVFPDLRHDLCARIDQLFRDAGIEMAFPQRDIHVRSIDAALGMLPRVAEPLKRAG
ncbi:MAG TPA: mechanosensitive ion channel domain-containing protein [Pirellulales bacterium]|jgi:potassium efflux system protein